MTADLATGTLARRLQAATGEPYEQCLYQVTDWETQVEGSAAWYVTTREMLHAAQVTLDARRGEHDLEVRLEPLGIGHEGAVVSGPGTSTELELDAADGYCGYYWRTDGGDPRPMANFVHDDEPITVDRLRHDPETCMEALSGAVAWIVGRYIDDPETYRDDGRPSSVGAPIWE